MHPSVLVASAGGKTIVFGLFKRNAWVYAELAPNARKPTRQAGVRGQVDLNSVIHSGGWRGYDGLVDRGYAKHLRVEHGRNEFVNERSHMRSHINGIESFWADAKLPLSKSKRIHKHMFYCHLKETEFRFDHRRDSLYLIILKLLREQPV